MCYMAMHGRRLRWLATWRGPTSGADCVVRTGLSRKLHETHREIECVCVVPLRLLKVVALSWRDNKTRFWVEQGRLLCSRWISFCRHHFSHPPENAKSDLRDGDGSCFGGWLLKRFTILFLIRKFNTIAYFFRRGNLLSNQPARRKQDR